MLKTMFKNNVTLPACSTFKPCPALQSVQSAKPTSSIALRVDKLEIIATAGNSNTHFLKLVFWSH